MHASLSIGDIRRIGIHGDCLCLTRRCDFTDAGRFTRIRKREDFQSPIAGCAKIRFASLGEVDCDIMIVAGEVELRHRLKDIGDVRFLRARLRSVAEGMGYRVRFAS